MKSKVLRAIADMLFPRICPVCGKALNIDEKFVCALCMAQLPRTGYHDVEFNPIEQLFAGKIPIERAAGYFFYERGGRHASILHSIKYHNQPRMGEWLARRFAMEMKSSGFLDDIDVVVPVPLHRGKLAVRGYNQSVYIGKGFSGVIGCSVRQLVKAVKGHETQTHKGQHERLLNTVGVYSATDEAVNFKDKHILLVDDVITTGATLLSCAEALRQVADMRISVATLAVARLQ